MKKERNPWTFKDYWERKKDERNQIRRDKYNSDPEYHAAVRATAKQNYKRYKRRMSPIDRRTLLSVDGTRYWSIGRIARLISRNITTIRLYHKKGVIPEPRTFDSRGWRLYSTQQAILLRQLFRRLDDESDTGVKSLADLSAIIYPRWEAADGEEKGK